MPYEYPVDIYPTGIDSQGCVAFPVSQASDQKWVVILTGIACFNFKGTGSTWNRGTLHVGLGDKVQRVFDIAGRKPSQNKILAFQVQDYANFATINAICDAEHAVDAGFAVDAVSPMLVDMPDARRLFEGLNVNMAVSDVDAQILRVGFQVTMTGKIVETSGP